MTFSVLARALCLSVSVAILSSCTETPQPKAPEPEPQQSEPETVCRHMASLGCKEARPTPKGQTCETWVAGSAKRDEIDLGCMARITDCGELRSCGR